MYLIVVAACMKFDRAQTHDNHTCYALGRQGTYALCSPSPSKNMWSFSELYVVHA